MKTELLPIGCIFDGNQGQETNNGRVIDLANEYGANIDKDTLQDENEIDFAVDEAVELLQEFVPAGHWAGWYEGDFGVYPLDIEWAVNDGSF